MIELEEEKIFMEADSESISMDDMIQEHARKLGVDLSQVDLDSISLPPHFDDDQEFLNDISSDVDFGGECEENCLNDFSNVIVIDNLPIVGFGTKKFGKLESIIRELDGIKTGTIKPDGFWMPINPETQETLGYCFIEFNTREEAEHAKKKTDGRMLDRRHKFAVTLMEEFDRLINTPEEFIVPDSDEKPSICQENLHHWLTDYKARDQYSVQAGEHLEVYWNDLRLSEPEFVHNLEIESLVQWSPMGTYLAVGDKEGVTLHGSAAGFCPLIHFAHPQVKLFDFSPGEKYLVSYDISSSSTPKNEQTLVLRMFDVRTGRVVRSFRKNRDLLANGLPPGSSIRWSGGRNDMYFAIMENNILLVCETQNFLKTNKSLRKIENVQSFSWSPTDPILAASIEESHDQPARVILIDVQKKQEVRQKTLFNVNLSNMYWQRNGDYLAIHVDYKKRTAKGNESAIHIFWMREPGIPVEILELETDNDKIIEFSWEPKGQSFGVIHGDNMRPDVSFYSLKKTSNTSKFSKLQTLRSKQANTLQWSPAGRFVVIAGLKDFGGKLEFFDAHEFKTSAMTEHYLATGIEWDPTGR
ncbi:OLC1v1031448C2 [Oldenlandia corymbosa var. corymbosa]|nr:OLC1v1031448C2 [Oldenlandia corymbosa var. corymbosa]